MKKLFFYTVIVTLAVGVSFTLGEVAVRLFSPSPYMYPRYKYSPKYGFILFENVRMEHGFPGKFKFHYTVNEYACRGAAVTPASRYAVPNIVVLGDSYSFGIGVDDGEEYASALREKLGGDYNIVNLATPGWGLAQEIRRYYDFGTLYRPEAVILQYCSNDPDNKVVNMVTTIDNGEFKFVDREAGIHWVKKYLSKSPIQRSQLYNFFRIRAFRQYQAHVVGAEPAAARTEKQTGQPPSRKELFYCELLEQFASELKKNGVPLIMIAVSDHLDRNPYIKDAVARLNESGMLDYLDTAPWFEGITDYKSPEGHWDRKGHDIIAGHIANHIRASVTATNPQTSTQ